MSETYELTTKTKQDVEHVLQLKSEEIMAVAAPNVRLDSGYLTRAKLTLLQNADVAKLAGTAKGMRTFVEAVTNTAMIGLTFGGPKPQAYLVPKDGGILAIYEASGYKYACTYGPGAILAEYPRTIIVKEGDSVKVDPDAGTIIYKDGGFNPFDPNRGKVVGYLMRLVYKDGRRSEVREIDVAKVKKIEAEYSMMNSPMFRKSPEEADLKTAEKSMLRVAFKESCQRAQVKLEGADADDGFDEEPATPPPMKDAEERTSTVLKRATAKMEPVAEPDLAPEAKETVAEAGATESEQVAPEAEPDPKPETEDLFK